MADETARTLLVVGAARGAGRWLVEHVLPSATWSRVILADVHWPARERDLARLSALYSAPLNLAVSQPHGALSDLATGRELPVPGPASAVVAVPSAAIGDAVGGVARATPPGTPVVVVSHAMRRALRDAARAADGRPVAGLHALFDPSAQSAEGQILYLARDGADAGAPVPELPWLEDAVVAAGGILTTGTAAGHDDSMRYVQALAHQTLVAFADAITRSGRDLDAELWAARTPLFETLLGLAMRVMDTRQQATIADIQDELGAGVAREIQEAVQWFSDAESGLQSAQHIEEIRDRISGSLFATAKSTAGLAISAAQRTRAELAHLRRTGELVGLVPAGDLARLRVGRIAGLTSTHVELEELMVGRRGRAAILGGEGEHNAKRLGVGGKRRTVRFALGHVEVLTGRDLDAELDEWLARIPRDVRFLVPESVAGEGVREVVSSSEQVRSCSLREEVVRTGQRSVVLHLEIRADRDVDRAVEQLRQRVASAYAWPAGVSRPLAADVGTVSYLGPAGSFSEDAARLCAGSTGLREAEFVPSESFDEVLAAVGTGTIAVLPISSSSSGLVSRAVSAILAASDRLVAGGMVDVPVRFDAYVRPGVRLGDLAGHRVFSHPQAIAQCSGFIERFKLIPVETPSTSESLRAVAELDEPAVALAGVDRGGDVGLEVAEREVDDVSGSITRFLILGDRDTFGERAAGADPTLRSIWIVDDPSALPRLLRGATAEFDEILTDADGRSLLVTSRDADDPVPGARYLGRIPWSPRTPVVRVGSPS